jgi:RNA polymerase sigma factor (sigma-70 family)
MGPSGGAGHEGAAWDVKRQQGTAAMAEDVKRDQRTAAGGGEPGAEPIDAAARNRAAVETFARHEASLRRTAQRYSICADDADEALQRGLEILLHKAPTDDPRELVRWTQTVVKHEALAVRAERERILAGPAAAPEPESEDWVALLPTEADGPAERAERHEAVERSREALASLKPQELRALTLLAEGYSYREISQITSYSATKVNRVLAEGRERFRHFLVRRDGGARCAELAPLLSAFADGEAAEAAVSTLREHLRSCPHCRATLRAYRAVPRAAAALAPALPPLRGSLADRLHDAYAAVATRVGGGSGASDSTLGGFVAAGGGRGAGMAALAKVLAICAGTVGGAAACVATGVVPAPLLGTPDHHSTPAAQVSHHPRQLADEEVAQPTVDYETEPAGESGSEPAPQEAEAQPEPHATKPRHEKPQPTEEVAASTPPPSESGATEYVEPAPEPTPETTSSATTATASSSSSTASPSSGASGTAAGEFGP